MTKRKRYDQATTFVPAIPSHNRQPTAQNASVDAPQGVIDLIRQPNATTGHARSDDDALTAAKAHLLTAAAYGAAGLLITLGLLMLAWTFRWLGGSWPGYVFGGLLLWGFVIVVALAINRAQGLRHSPSGIALEELTSRERIAMHVADTHADLMAERWRIEAAQESEK